MQYVGKGAGKGYNINIPWPHTMVDGEDYEEAIESICVPAIKAFQPQLIIVACGFDAVEDDILAGTNLPATSYYEMTRLLKECGIPMAVVLEGGYAPPLIAEAAANVVSSLLGPLRAERPLPRVFVEGAEEFKAEEVEEAGGNAAMAVEKDGENGENGEEQEEDEEKNVSYLADDEHVNYIDARLIMNGIRTKLNKIEPWKSTFKGRKKVFLEKNFKFTGRDMKKFSALMQESLAEFE
jgi:hypothetical protein